MKARLEWNSQQQFRLLAFSNDGVLLEASSWTAANDIAVLVMHGTMDIWFVATAEELPRSSPFHFLQPRRVYLISPVADTD